ncbi:hypothetical protein OH76DRAFT_1417346 [Lentinus brumalis]|uniref:Uncharacterized protein n=1 Tax=Lentinus brumalis TaxID=2498619 RepID=A0A371DFJ3_9APHY|nr:hypothetical protein OH76DRAFT_1417346 [Polyporus brumalis]
MHSTLLIKQSAVITIYVEGARKYSAPAAIGLVKLADSAEVVLCALTGHDSYPSLLSASVATFGGTMKLNTTSLALISERGMVCFSFQDQNDMEDFLGAYETAHASAGFSGQDASARDGSPEPDESATFSLLASHLATMDGDWDLLDFAGP